MRTFGFCILSLLCISYEGCDNNSVLLVKHKALADRINYEIDSFVNTNNYFEGFAVAIVNEKGILYENGFGFADNQAKQQYETTTLQNIGSISKTFIGVSLMKAQELGKLRLDDPINKYLPFQVSNPAFPDIPITIRQLANHTSSITDCWNYYTKNYFLLANQNLDSVNYPSNGIIFNPPTSALTLEQFLRNLLEINGKWRVKESFSHNKPGTMYEYSNTGATLAAFIVQQATGISFDSFTRQNILIPLNMNASGWNFKEVDSASHSRMYTEPGKVLPFYGMSSYPDGNFITSVHDLSLFLQELIKGYIGKGILLQNESYKELFRQQLTTENFTSRSDKNPYNDDYNMGVFMASTPTGIIGHSGSDPGVVSLMFFDPKTKAGSILIVNTSFTGSESKATFFKIFDILAKYQSPFQNL